MTRKLIDVIAEMKSLLQNETQQSLLNELNKIEESLNYAPPENEPIWWERTREELMSHLSLPIKEDWQIQLISIFTLKSQEAVKAEFGEKEISEKPTSALIQLIDKLSSHFTINQFDTLLSKILSDDESQVRIHLKELSKSLNDVRKNQERTDIDWYTVGRIITKHGFVLVNKAEGDIDIELLQDNPDMIMKSNVERIDEAISLVPVHHAPLIMDLKEFRKTAAGLYQDQFEASLMAKIIYAYFFPVQAWKAGMWEYEFLSVLFRLPENTDVQEYFGSKGDDAQIASFKGKTIKERGVYNSICDLKAVIPDSEIELQNKLHTFLDIVSQVPSSHYNFWLNKVANIFEEVIPLIVEEEWHFKVLSIVNQLPLDKARKLFSVQQPIADALAERRIFDAQALTAFIRRSSIDEEAGQKILNFVQAATTIKYGSKEDIAPFFGFFYVNPILQGSGYIGLWVVDIEEVNLPIQNAVVIRLSTTEETKQFRKAHSVDIWPNSADIEMAIEQNLKEFING